MKPTRQLVLATVVVALVSACGALGSPAQGSSEPRTPGEQASPQATPIAVAARVQDLTAAVGALGGLSSYRFSMTSTGTGIIVGPGATVGAAAMRGIIVNGTLPRALVDSLSSGEVVMSEIQIGSHRWMSFAGSSYAPEDSGATDATLDLPFESTLLDAIAGSTTALDLGIETRNGIATRHLQAHPIRSGNAFPGSDVTAPPEPATPAPATAAPPTPNEPTRTPHPTNGPPTAGTDATPDEAPGSGELGPVSTTVADASFDGVLDAWIALDGGYLVAAHLDGTIAGLSMDDSAPAATPSQLTEDISIDGVGDSANQVLEPSAPSLAPLPSGDPQVVALIAGTTTALQQLTSYVVRITSATGQMT